MNIRALILAAGRGSRMGAATDNLHKCLTILDKKALLHWQLESLRKAGIEDITVVRGYKAELIVGDFNTINNERWNETNMVGSLFCAPFFDGDTIISYSDIVYRSSHVTQLKDSQHNITIVADVKWRELWEKRFENPLDDAETFRYDGERLLEIGGKTGNIQDIQAQYMGLLKVTSIGWQQMYGLYNKYNDKKKDKIDMTSLLSELLINNIPIHIEFVNGGWCEVDNYNDVLTYEKELLHSDDWTHNWK